MSSVMNGVGASNNHVPLVQFGVKHTKHAAMNPLVVMARVKKSQTLKVKKSQHFHPLKIVQLLSVETSNRSIQKQSRGPPLSPTSQSAPIMMSVNLVAVVIGDISRYAFNMKVKQGRLYARSDTKRNCDF